MIAFKDFILFQFLVCLLFITSGCNGGGLPEPPIGGDTPKPIEENDVTPGITRTPTQKQPGTNPSGNVWINSYPVGAEVYIVPSIVDLNNLNVDDIYQPENKAGTAPLYLDLKNGSYYGLTFFPAELYDKLGVELPVLSSPSYREAFPSDGDLIHSVSYREGEYINDISRVYRISIDTDREVSLISVALPLPENERQYNIPFIYPTLGTVRMLPVDYDFEHDVMRRAIKDTLNEYNLSGAVSDTMVDEMIEVLSHAGKVILKTNTIRMMVQMSGFGDNSFNISIYQ